MAPTEFQQEGAKAFQGKLNAWRQGAEQKRKAFENAYNARPEADLRDPAARSIGDIAVQKRGLTLVLNKSVVVVSAQAWDISDVGLGAAQQDPACRQNVSDDAWICNGVRADLVTGAPIPVQRNCGEKDRRMAEDLPTGGVIDIAAIMRMIPHRYPFLLIDRVIDVVSGDSATGIKNVTVNEPFFPGHFPARRSCRACSSSKRWRRPRRSSPSMPWAPKPKARSCLFMSIDDCRFRRPVTPGDQLRLEVKKDRARGPVWRFIGVAKVDGQVVAEATFAAMIRDR